MLMQTGKIPDYSTRSLARRVHRILIYSSFPPVIVKLGIAGVVNLAHNHEEGKNSPKTQILSRSRDAYGNVSSQLKDRYHGFQRK